jgi:hypothetical protein
MAFGNLCGKFITGYELTVYYCEAEEERLCMIHNARLGLPFETAESGPAVVRAPYQVSTEG